MSQVSSEQEYLSLFNAINVKVYGEASVLYLYSKLAPQQIFEFNPKAKIVILVRRQEEFLPSFHNQLCLNFQESIGDFQCAWELSGHRTLENIPSACRVEMQLNYKEMGLFYKFSKRYFDVFPQEQIRLFHYDDWVCDPRVLYQEMLTFLGLTDDGRTDFPRVNARSRHRYVSIARFLQQPPWPVKGSVKLLHKSLGVRSLGLAESIERLNRRVDLSQDISDEMKEQIRNYYRADNRLLKPLICRPQERRDDSPSVSAGAT
jgi:hypothetical protein